MIRALLVLAWRAFVAVLVLSLALVVDDLLKTVPALERRIARLVERVEALEAPKPAPPPLGTYQCPGCRQRVPFGSHVCSANAGKLQCAVCMEWVPANTLHHCGGTAS